MNVTQSHVQSAFVLGLLFAAPFQVRAAETKPGEIVTLVTRGVSEACPGEARHVNAVVRSDGTTVPLVIAAGHSLVVTSAAWRATGLPSRIYNLEISIVTEQFASPGFIGGGTMSDATGNISGAVQFPPGFVAKRGTRLCASIESGPVESVDVAADAFVMLYGMLVKDKDK